MGAVIMNLGNCAKEGVLLALKSMCNIVPKDIPKIEMQSVSQPRIYSNYESYVSLVVLKHESVKGSGFIILNLPKKNIKKIMDKAGLKDVTPHLITDFCGEFCSIIAGVFKTEIQKLGLGLIQIGLPLTYAEGVDQPIEDVHVEHKYLITIFDEDEQLLTLEVAFSSLKSAG
ncbi:MAG: hypothetical protein PHN49_05545 [Candidatus Omnitrophica bacterium]|nr:hypothetical protein [Candidatus Omnitrophota bacterium]MDD5671081.1 hypothetical protein [Candidatus Omnitrophota bacterium]